LFYSIITYVFDTHKPCHIAKGKTIQMTNPTASVLLKKPYHPTVFSTVWMQAKRHLAGERWQHFRVAFFAPWYSFLIIVLRVCGLHFEYQKHTYKLTAHRVLFMGDKIRRQAD